MKNDHKLVNWLKITLGIVFIGSSILKIISIQSFSLEVGQYIDLYMPQWLHGRNMLCSIGVCASELFVGLLVFCKGFEKTMIFLSIVMLSFFVWLTGVNLFFPTVFGSVESCGCFGELVHFTPIGSFIKSLVLWTLALVIFVNVIINRKQA